MSHLTRKGYARIYVDKPDNVPVVEKIICELDEFEFGYLPTAGDQSSMYGLVAPFSQYPKLRYTHKFDGLCMNRLAAVCWTRGIHIWVCDNGSNEHMDDARVTKA